MIFQLHHQRIDNPKVTELVAQGDPSEVGVPPEGMAEFLQNWVRDVAESRPLPEGYQWLICNEEYEGFVRVPLT